MTDTTLLTFRKTLNSKLADYRAADTLCKQDRIAFIEAEDHLLNTDQAQQVISFAAQQIQQEAHCRLSNVVSECLSAVFDNAYTFRIDFERKRGKTEAQIKFIRDGLELDDPLEQAGGGVVEVAAFALRLACMVLQRPPLRRVLVLDEPWKCIRGKVYRERVRDMVLKLANDLGVQFVLCVDHEAYPQFLLGKVVEIG